MVGEIEAQVTCDTCFPHGNPVSWWNRGAGRPSFYSAGSTGGSNHLSHDDLVLNLIPPLDITTIVLQN